MVMSLPDDERYAVGEALNNYALRPYSVDHSHEGRLHASNIFAHSLRTSGLENLAAPVVEGTRREFGRSGTAWGIKDQPGQGLSWELYYYQHANVTEPLRVLSSNRLRSLLNSWGLVTDAAATPEGKRFSLSFDVDEAVLRGESPAKIHEYLDQGPTTPPTALSYSVEPSGLKLENIYVLCRQQPADLDFPYRWVYSSVHLDPDTFHIDEVLWPELLDCDHLAFAHKPRCEGIYFGGIDIDQLMLFLERTNFSAPVSTYICDNRDGLTHLRFDVGFDIIGAPGGGVEVTKAAIYSSL